MSGREIHAVTGAFGYSGKYIARRLLDKGRRVITLTNSPQRPNQFGEALDAHPFNFDAPDALRKSLEGVSVLYVTYWVRFNHRDFTHAEGMKNTFTLFEAARDAGVRRIVHVSITNPAKDANVEYFRCKALMEEKLQGLGPSYAILRPAILFGKEDILVNNIAWTLRYFPIVGLFGSGDYALQPIYVDDLAALAVEQGEREENVVIDAIGPETFTYRELVETIGAIIGKKRLVLPMSAPLAYAMVRLTGWLMGDKVVTWEEMVALMAGRLCTASPPAGLTKLTEWAREHADELGYRYTSELARRNDRAKSYEED